MYKEFNMDKELIELRKKAMSELDMCCQTLCNKTYVIKYIQLLEKKLKDK